ncbi:SDR family NAD(P)-dependent oxidoreductase [Nocardia niigatensis]
MTPSSHNPVGWLRDRTQQTDPPAADPGTASTSYDVVVGASSGLGAALAIRLMGQMRPVVLAARRVDRLNGIAAAHTSPSEYVPICVQTDLRDAGDVTKLADTIQNIGRPVGNLYLVAGANEPAGTDDPHARYNDLSRYLGMALTGPIALVESLEHRNALTCESVVVGISSIAAAVPFDALPVYGAAKAAFEQWLRATRHPDKARRVVVRPGRFASEFFPRPGATPLLPHQLAARITARVGAGDDEITVGDRGDRRASRLHQLARSAGQRLVTDARTGRSDT